TFEALCPANRKPTVCRRPHRTVVPAPRIRGSAAVLWGRLMGASENMGLITC
ncbi:hypothetical protein NEUTE2DRAFT_55857, partial [Neurospora tetrasperma FGSC 2509]